jgi:hypothetical protein
LTERRDYTSTRASRKLRRARAEVAVVLPTGGDIGAQDFDAVGKAGCSIGGGSTVVVSISSSLLIAR